MLKLRIGGKWNLVPAFAYFILAAAGMVALGVIGFSLWGAVGIAGVVIVAGALVLTGFLTAVEDDKPGGFNNPRKSDRNDE